MSTTVRFTDGHLLDLTLMNDTDCLLTLSLSSKTIRHSVVVAIDGTLVVYRILRKSKEAGPIRSLLNQVEENLSSHYHFEMKGLVWGQPAITRIKGRWWWLLNEIPIIDELGNLSALFQEILDKYNIVVTDKTQLLQYFNSVRNTAVFKRLETN
ncbi:hypothetical protein MOA67_gp299 [Klebsiella phage KpLz-2_45]|uniref:hypothetical protein n=1 Tax=Klebsiella phage KpLz-2_45 TaxID=2698923 RepID=UPI001F143603|nr:hypothetical protein MOA67_gp299 [Klebsiella phage KpLz-2_45]UKS72124.1 hypothetical protein KpLz245_2580 [Klebsiella phage KpLz-2_45]DAX11239.1 MAG TPA: hypothetical protein [Bacteriophage sp.]